MSSFRIQHPTLGYVRITERVGSGKLSARWINGELQVNVPAGVGRMRIEDVISRHAADFEAMRPQPRYNIGQTVDCHDFNIEISQGNISQHKPEVYVASTTGEKPRFVITVPPSRAIGAPEIQQSIARCIHLAARRFAPLILIPRGKALAEKFGLRVDKWEIASGKTILGTCFPRQKRIKLSYMCVFLDRQLRDYIICHELVHLTETGHTPAFHQLCDSYCGGREDMLISRLRIFPWPVDR